MKKWLVGAVIVFGLIIIIYLDKNEIIRWQPLSIIIAAIAAPFRLIMAILGNNAEEVRKRHEAIRQRETEYQTDIDRQVQDREQKISNLKKEIDIIDTRLELLQKRRQLVEEEVKKMSLKEMQEAGRKYFGAK